MRRGRLVRCSLAMFFIAILVAIGLWTLSPGYTREDTYSLRQHGLSSTTNSYRRPNQAPLSGPASLTSRETTPRSTSVATYSPQVSLELRKWNDTSKSLTSSMKHSSVEEIVSGAATREFIAELHRPKTTSPKATAEQSFVIVQEYSDQLSVAMLGYMQLAQVADSLGLSIVEPFIQRSRVIGIPKQNDTSVPSLSDFFNFTVFQCLLHQCSVLHQPERRVHTFQDFLVQSSRRLVTIKLYKTHTPELRNTLYPCNASSDDYHIEASLNSHLNKAGAELSDQSGQRFSVTGSFCIQVDTFFPVSVQSIFVNVSRMFNKQYATYSGVHETSVHFTLVLLGLWSFCSIHPARYSIYDPSIEFQSHSCKGYALLPHSNLVISFAEAFISSLNVTKPLIAVHLRFERLLRAAYTNKVYQSRNLFFAECVGHIRAVLKHVLITKNSTIILVHDMKEYGSIAAKLHPDRRKLAQKVMIEKLTDLGLKVVSFNPKDPQFEGAPDEQTFAALVEQEALTMADQLVAVGGGFYQQNVVERFLQTHENKNLHVVCKNTI